MQEKTLVILALSCAGIGIIILFLFLQFSSLPSSEISQITPNDLGSMKQFNGTITQITTKNNTTFITLTQQNTITVVLFNEPSPSFKKDDFINVVGKVDNYKGSYEIIADKVERIDK